MSELAGVQEVRWDGSIIAPAGEYTFFYGKGKENHELGTDFFVRKRNGSAPNSVEFASDRISYIILKCRWCLSHYYRPLVTELTQSHCDQIF
jgi:hypothetical protein